MYLFIYLKRTFTQITQCCICISLTNLALIPLEHSEKLFSKCKSPCLLITPTNMEHSQMDYENHIVNPVKNFLKRQGNKLSNNCEFDIPEYIKYYNNI